MELTKMCGETLNQFPKFSDIIFRVRFLQEVNKHLLNKRSNKTGWPKFRPFFSSFLTPDWRIFCPLTFVIFLAKIYNVLVNENTVTKVWPYSESKPQIYNHLTPAMLKVNFLQGVITKLLNAKSKICNKICWWNLRFRSQFTFAWPLIR